MIISSGIDVGTSAVKIAIMASGEGGGRERADARLLAKICERIRRRDARDVVQRAYADALKEAGLQASDVHYVATTGEGENVDFRIGHFYGMTANARGAIFLDPQARATVDAGALHGRAIKMDERSKVLGYRMTSQCASGSGQFLENIARYLGVTLDEIGKLSENATGAEKISGICAVLAETDVINMVSRGVGVANILKGIHDSMAGRFVKLLRSVGAEGVVLLTGGLSADRGLLSSMRASAKEAKIKDIEIRTHPDAVLSGAIGAALWGAYRHEKLMEQNAA